ncbi:MAG: hypothetical protein PHI05_01265 [Bacilli bacterium]|nr:hypothetical protein [Bacilli bacterium]MDD4547357.1 hypothetical protein [Bacilli bacterium]
MTIKKNTLIIIMTFLALFSATTYIIVNNNKNDEQSKFMSENGESSNTTDKVSDVSNNKDNVINNKNKQNINPNTNKDLPVSSDENIINDSINNPDKLTIEPIIPQDKPQVVEPSYNNIKEPDSNVSSVNKEEEVISYFRTLELETIENTEESNFDKVKEKINNVFFTTVDFIFYDKPIKGVTFDELTSKTKLEILNIASRIDNMIIKQFPNYKKTIKDGSNKAYQFTAIQIGNLQNTIKEAIGEDNYNKAADSIESGKDKVVEVKDNLFTNIKKWYENLREN